MSGSTDSTLHTNHAPGSLSFLAGTAVATRMHNAQTAFDQAPPLRLRLVMMCCCVMAELVSVEGMSGGACQCATLIPVVWCH